MKRDNIIFLLLGISILMFLGYVLTSEISEDCRSVSPAKCKLLWVTAISSMIGGGLLTELLIIRRRQSTGNKPRSDKSTTSGIGIWQRATLRVVLSSLLTSAPLLIRGSFVAVAAGAGIGMALVSLVGRLTGQITDGDGT